MRGMRDKSAGAPPPGELAVGAARFPIAVPLIAALLTVTACGALVRAAWGSYRLAQLARDRYTEGERLAGVITHLDEVLTMSARMAAATGDLAWQSRYQEFEPRLDAAIRQAIDLEHSPANVEAGSQTAAANAYLVRLERSALELARADRGAEARAILDGADYRRLKADYAAGVARLAGHLRGQLDGSLEAMHRLTLGAFFAALAVSAVSLLAWVAVARRLRAWRAALEAGAAERRRLEEQFRQAQKMEAVGRLAGGVAHDFNNILTVIMGFGDRLLKRLPEGDAVREDAEEIGTAARRAAALTRQLLTFTRRQVVEPMVIDIGAVLGAMQGMLRRLLGEDLDLRLKVDAGARPVLIDRGQLEQIVMNLAINARDAMPDGGALTISVEPARPEDARAAEHVTGATEPRAWATVSVADTGHGMDSETRSHLFEPFFTTKRVGRGTGLGLATVYAIVQQSGGTIAIASDPGRGTEVRIHLPCVDARAERPSGAAPAAADAVPPAGAGWSTVLLVEDEAPVRDLARRILDEAGYRVLAAASAEEALRLASGHRGPLDLLATDVVMPGLSGRDLGERLRRQRPGLRVLYLSGYTADVRVQGAVAAGSAFLAKPFTHEDLLAAVRRLLAEARHQVAGAAESPVP